MKKEELIKHLRSLREKDAFYDSGTALSSMCSKPDGLGVEAFELYRDANLLDGDLFPNARILEAEAIKKLGLILSNTNPSGCLTSGSTEGNLTALWVARRMKPGAIKVMIPESAHYSLPKIAEIMGLDVVYAPLDENYKAKVEFIRENLNESFLACVLTAGTTELGVIDPVEEVEALCREKNVFLHVDAAYGGFIIPFLRYAGYAMPGFDFALEGVCSVTADPHKMGLAPIPAGAVLFRDNALSSTIRKPEYLSNSAEGFLGTKTGGSAAAVWALLEYYGIEGYSRIAAKCMENARSLFSELEGMDGVTPVMKPVLPVVCFKTRGKKESIRNALYSMGWRINYNKASNNFRIVVMPHVTEEAIGGFLKDLREILRNA